MRVTDGYSGCPIEIWMKADDEAHLPTEHAPTQEEAWLSRSDEDESGPGDSQATPHQRPHAAVGLVAHPRPMARLIPLRTAREFRRVRRVGNKARSDGVTVIAAPVPRGTEARLGISIPAASGLAVERNRARRRIKEIMRQLSDPTDSDLIVQARAEAVGADFQELTKHVQAAYARATREVRSR